MPGAKALVIPKVTARRFAAQPTFAQHVLPFGGTPPRAAPRLICWLDVYLTHSTLLAGDPQRSGSDTRGVWLDQLC